MRLQTVGAVSDGVAVGGDSLPVGVYAVVAVCHAHGIETPCRPVLGFRFGVCLFVLGRSVEVFAKSEKFLTLLEVAVGATGGENSHENSQCRPHPQSRIVMRLTGHCVAF